MKVEISDRMNIWSNPKYSLTMYNLSSQALVSKEGSTTIESYKSIRTITIYSWVENKVYIKYIHEASRVEPIGPAGLAHRKSG